MNAGSACSSCPGRGTLHHFSVLLGPLRADTCSLFDKYFQVLESNADAAVLHSNRAVQTESVLGWNRRKFTQTAVFPRGQEDASRSRILQGNTNVSANASHNPNAPTEIAPREETTGFPVLKEKTISSHERLSPGISLCRRSCGRLRRSLRREGGDVRYWQ